MNIQSHGKLIGLIVLLLIVGSICWVKPWLSKGRTISVTGQGTISAIPDEFVFNVTYQKTAATATEANSEAAKVGNEVVAKLKELGLDEKQIKTNVSTNPSYEIAPADKPSKPTGQTSNYTVTITTESKEEAQKVQDYLSTTEAQYGYSPNAAFSKETQEKLEEEARTKALEDARKKAEKTASQLGVKVGKVMTVSDVQQTGGPIPLARDMAAQTTSSESKLVAPTVEGGSQDLTFSVTVTYQIR